MIEGQKIKGVTMVKTGQRHQGIKAVWRVKPPIPFGGSLKWLVAALLLTGCADSEQAVDETSQAGNSADFESQLPHVQCTRIFG